MLTEKRYGNDRSKKANTEDRRGRICGGGGAVGSKAIAQRMPGKISSATIRNELADLTEMGYLEQPHTSAGRVPSAKGYRLYVNELMEHRAEPGGGG